MDEAEQLHKTRTGSRTTGYAAPEVLSGIIGPKMDYYALGVTLWELLTGKDPFTMENGKRRNDAHLIRDTIEGRIADDILSKEPRVSRNMERLIRGLLVIDPDHRWGYDEVTRHLAGETVEIYQQQKKAWTLSIGSTSCSTLEELGAALLDNPEDARRLVYKNLLSEFLGNDYPKIAKEITEVAEEASAANDLDNGVLKAAYILNPGLPLKVDNDFTVQNPEELIFLLENAPESVVPLLRSPKSKLHTWLGIIGSANTAAEISALPADISDAEFAGKAEVLLRNKVIKPFKLAAVSHTVGLSNPSSSAPMEMLVARSRMPSTWITASSFPLKTATRRNSDSTAWITRPWPKAWAARPSGSSIRATCPPPSLGPKN